MTDTKREDKLKRIPAQSGRSDLPPGKLRSISMDEIDALLCFVRQDNRISGTYRTTVRCSPAVVGRP